MKPLEIKGARTRLGLSQQYMADQLNMSIHSYQKKESGKIKFADTEKAGVARILKLTPWQVNDFLYDGLLPIGNNANNNEQAV